VDAGDENDKQYGAHCPKLKTDPKHGTWAYYLSHGSDPKTKQRVQFRKAGHATRREAASAAAELKTKLDTNSYVKPTNVTLGEYAQEWLPRRESTGKGLRATTLAGYRYYIAEDIRPSALGRMKLTDIRRYHVQEFVNDQTKAKRGTVTVRRLVTLLGTIFASAVKDELISTNPARDVDAPNWTVNRWRRGNRTKSGCSWNAPPSIGLGQCSKSPS
jgi:hypothetical protein